MASFYTCKVLFLVVEPAFFFTNASINMAKDYKLFDLYRRREHIFLSYEI